MVGGVSCVADGMMAPEDSTSMGESCSSEDDDDEKEGFLAGADLRRGGAALAGFEVGRGGLKARTLRFGAVFEDPEGMAVSFTGSQGSFVF